MPPSASTSAISAGFPSSRNSARLSSSHACAPSRSPRKIVKQPSASNAFARSVAIGRSRAARTASRGVTASTIQRCPSRRYPRPRQKANSATVTRSPMSPPGSVRLQARAARRLACSCSSRSHHPARWVSGGGVSARASEIRGMLPLQGRQLATGCQALQRVLADRLQHHKAGFAVHARAVLHQAGVDEPLESVDQREVTRALPRAGRTRPRRPPA